MKSAFVSVIGRPSSGKSTLLNSLCGVKVSIVSAVPQTTRHKVRAIVNRPEGQLVFIDTPGVHKSERKYNTQLNEIAYSALDESDLILYLLDGTRLPGEEEKEIAQLLQRLRNKVIPVVNKKDEEGYNGQSACDFLKEQGFSNEGIPEVSALKKVGLETLLDTVYRAAPEGPPMYPEDFYTDQPPEFRISEIIREKAMNRVSQEIPHALTVEIADLEMNGEEMWVRAFIIVERETQKAIVVGRKGTNLGEIRSAARREIKKFFPGALKLDIVVKVNPRWRKQDYYTKMAGDR